MRQRLSRARLEAEEAFAAASPFRANFDRSIADPDCSASHASSFRPLLRAHSVGAMARIIIDNDS